MGFLHTNCFTAEHTALKEEVTNMIKTHSRYYNFSTDFSYQRKMQDDSAKVKDLLRRKRAGESVDVSFYKAELKSAGIIDSDGKLKEIYRTGVRK